MKLALGVCALVVMSAVLGAAPARAQEKAARAKPPLSTSQALLGQWNDVGRKLIAMAEDFPKDKYDFKPTPAQQSFGQRVLHAGGVNYFFTDVALGRKAPSMASANPDQFKTKADIVAFVKKSFADGADAIKKSDMNKVVTDPFSNDRVRLSDYAYGFVEHSGEIYGQLVVYYRVAGMVPPESRPKK